MSYTDDLKTVNWQKKRLLIFERDGWKCTVPNCPTPEYMLSVHHVDYIPSTKAWEHPDDMLTTLCKNCHDKEQQRPKEEQYLINTLRMKGFLVEDILAHSVLIETSEDFTKRLLKILRDFQNK